MKILVLTNLYPPHHAGTYDFRCETLTEALRLRGHTMHVLTSQHGMTSEQRGGEIERRLLLNGIFEHPSITRLRELQTLETRNHQILQETIEEFKPDVIQVHSLEGLPKSFIFTLRNSRLPTVYDVGDYWLAHGLRHDPWLRWWNRPKAPILQAVWRASLELLGQRDRLDGHAPTRMMRGYDRLPDVYGYAATSATVQPNSISAFRFDRLYFCSHALKEATAQAGFRVQHGEVIYPGILAQLYVGEIKPASAPVNKFLVVARLVSRSGVLTAVQALRAAREQKVQATLSIYGQGDSDCIAEIRSFVAIHHLPVEFLPVSNIYRDLPAVYRRHDALLYTSEWDEPFSLTPLEAMACGLPVIGAASGGARELFRHGENALTYTPGSVEELASRIQEIQMQPALRCQLAETAQTEVLSKFNETIVVDKIENYLETSCEVWYHAAT